MSARARGVVLLGGALALLAGCPAPPRPACEPLRCRPHTVILVRHAEKEKAEASGQDNDPELSARGRERAARLATLLGSAGQPRLVATEFKRTRQTLEPLAERLGKPIEVRPAAQTNALVRELLAPSLVESTVVATHANVLPSMVEQLAGAPLRGLRKDGTMADDDYARVIVLTVGCTPDASAVVELSSD